MSLSLGQLVLYVRDLRASGRFYTEAIGLHITAELMNGRALMVSGSDTHHELMLIEVGEAPGPHTGRRLGLYHFAFCVGYSQRELLDAISRLEQAQAPIRGMSDHHITESVYCLDPDGNEVEIYRDKPDYDWHTRREWIEQPVRPLEIDWESR